MRSGFGVVVISAVLATATASAQTLPPRCVAASALPPLERYDQLVAGARFHLRVRWDATSRSWQPASPLGMPFHHASALEYVGWTAPPASGDTLELELEAIERVSSGVRGGTFFFTYRVRVLASCLRTG